jgi:hypothetical protein
LNSPKYIEKALSKSEFINLSVTAPKDIMAPFEYLKKLFNMPKNENIKVSLAKGSNGTVAKLSDGDFIGKDEGPGART